MDFKKIRDVLLWIGGFVVVLTDILNYIELLRIEQFFSVLKK